MKPKQKPSAKITLEQTYAVFSDNTEISLTLPCCICGDTFVSEKEGFYGDDVLDEFIVSAYKDGWRYSVSEAYGHIGIHCPICHKNRNNLKKLES